MLVVILGIMLACAVGWSFKNWRTGMLFCVMFGCIQDPIRKVTPGNPPYLILCVFPLYISMLIRVWYSRRIIPDFLTYFPTLLTPIQLFILTLIFSSIATMQYGIETVPIIALGWSFYVGWIPAVILGFYFLKHDYAELDYIFMSFAAIISMMLSGVPLEYFDIKFADPWLGTVGMGTEWRRWYSDTEWVAMLSGFFRAPEIMAWHAASLTCVSIYLYVRRPKYAVVWIMLITWGLACVALSGRRKMFILVLLFVCLFLLFTNGKWRGRVLISIFIGSIGVSWLLLSTVDDRYLDAASSGLTAATPRITNHTYSGPLWLITIVGPFGYGLGTKTQGTQHISEAIETPLIEGGFEKVLVELGVIGTTVTLFLAFNIIRLVYKQSKRMLHKRGDTTPLAALLSFLIANMLAFSVAFQVYGDPLICILQGFSLGLILASVRLIAPVNSLAQFSQHAHSARSYAQDVEMYSRQVGK